MQIKIEVYVIGHRETARQQVTEGIFTYVAIDDEGCPVKIKKEEVE